MYSRVQSSQYVSSNFLIIKINTFSSAYTCTHMFNVPSDSHQNPVLYLHGLMYIYKNENNKSEILKFFTDKYIL